MTTQNWSEDPLTAVPSGERVRSDSPAASSPAGESNGSAAVKDQAKDQAREVGREGIDAAQGVAQTATTEARNVAAEASTQAKNLLGELGADLKEQAGASQQKAAEGLRSISDELVSMADNGDQTGPANSLVRQAAQRSGDVAGWLEGRDPGSLLEEVKDFARRRPGTFLMVAAGAGLLAGRLTRGLAGAGSDSPATTPANPAPEYPPTVPAQPAAGTDQAAAATTTTPVTEATSMVNNGFASSGDSRETSSDPLADPFAAEPVIVPGTRTEDERLDRDLR